MGQASEWGRRVMIFGTTHILNRSSQGDPAAGGLCALLSRQLLLVLLGVFACGALFMSGCARTVSKSPTDDGVLRIVVTIPPLQGLVEALVPPGTQVQVLIPPGSSPHGFVPTPSSSAAVKTADLIVIVGMGLEGPTQRMVDRHAGGRVINFAAVVGEETASTGDGHIHDATCVHIDFVDGTGPDPHLWLDAALVERLVLAVANELITLGVVDASERAATLVERIKAADAQAASDLRPFAGSRIITQHDAWRRFAPRYGLSVLGSVLPAGIGEPTAGDMAQVLNRVEAARAESGAPIAIFTEPQLDPRPAERLATRLGLPLGTLDPLGDGDWFALLEHNTKVLSLTLAADSTGEQQPTINAGP